MNPRARVGAVSYLNARPLVFGLEQGRGEERVELSYDVPSVLASRMAAGELDVALLPTVELGRIPDLVVVPGLAIGSLGACRSVLLVARVPLARVRSVALDPESRTSNALVQVLADELWGIKPEFSTGPRDLALALREHDAVVRIGDKALFEPLPAGVVAHDLGEAWTSLTRLPFVFAVWASAMGALDRDLYQILHDSKRAADRVLDDIAADYTYAGRQYPDVARPYLREAIRYRFGGPELAGAKRFLASAARLGLIDADPAVRIAVLTEARCGA